MNLSLLNVFGNVRSIKSIAAAVEARERATYDYAALAKEYEYKCPADYPWMKKEECQELGKLWAWQAGAMTEAPGNCIR